jgi:uncharacterized membrane protein
MKEIGTARIEAFSDGVFAIAATLLVLEIGVSSKGGAQLGHELLRIWPSYLAYVTSFVTIGIIWINHHHNMRTIDRGFAPGLPSYVAVFALAFFSPLAAVIVTLALAAFYLPSAALFAER